MRTKPGRSARPTPRAIVLSMFTAFIFNHSLAVNAATFDGWAWLEHTPVLHAHFEQRIINKNGARLGRAAEGEFWIRRPGYFRWNYTQPNQQITLSNGHHLIWYDAQLKQEVIKPVKGSLNNALAQLLTSDASSIKTRFKSQQTTDDHQQSLIVTPYYPDREGFEQITLIWSFQNGQYKLNRISVTDSLKQTILFTLSQIDTPSASSLSPSLFSFTPPTGTSIVNEK